MSASVTTTRREFLQGSALALASAGLGGVGMPGNALAAAVLPTPDWVDRPMRWAQLTLVEDDPGNYDPQFWLDYFNAPSPTPSA